MIENALRVIWIGFYGWFFWINLRIVISGLAAGVITLGGKTAPIDRDADRLRFGRSLAWRGFLALFALALAVAPLVVMIVQPQGPAIITAGSPSKRPSH